MSGPSTSSVPVEAKKTRWAPFVAAMKKWTPSAATMKRFASFIVLCSLLIIATLGWKFAMSELGYWTRKLPVPWPAGVEINPVTFQCTSLPKKIGPFVRVESDGEIRGMGEKDGQPDGEITYRDDVLETLKVATTLDGERYDSRTSNWYVSRIYEDTREPLTSRYRYWSLSITYYTGSEFTVPHVPDTCAQSGGATLKDKKILRAGPIQGVPKSWADKAPLAALQFQSLDGLDLVSFYVFSVNGDPEPNRDVVRMSLMDLRKRYVYFAKIQFEPRNTMGDLKTTQKKALEFYETMLPEMLKQLPTQKQIKQLRK
jgi:hypothetical protein